MLIAGLQGKYRLANGSIGRGYRTISQAVFDVGQRSRNKASPETEDATMADLPKQNAKRTPSQAAAPTTDAADLGLRSIDAVAAMTRQNMQTMLTVAHGAVQGFEEVMTELAAFSRASFERAATAGRAMTAATTPNDLLKVQTDYTRQQVEAAMAEMTKLSSVLLKATRESLALSTDGAKPRGSDL